ncbi:serine/threonine protein kinase [Nocardia sp. CA2R105]|uniref:serine/threonine-protein kinase n=1 Tax=Nocardia coffeae TaxID=2873381 RepID=UPI001CA6B2DA|nr:serine/threonine-protein kinase [Nocardia coffeae]MBY8854958.1 serine/threonine protein kinase [Nocardia coffeae]
MVLQAGVVFAGFTIERLIGVGGMGAVYLARHPRMDRRVAVKVVDDGAAADPQARKAFDRETALAAGLDHPNIVAVYDRSGPDDPALWLSMQYIDGGDANALLAAAPGGLPIDQVLRLIGDAARALDHAHSQGVLHRDVKPANLLVDRAGRTLLTDFGIARSLDGTRTMTSVAATFAYAAPERFANLPGDQRADVYSLGCTLFELLTGRTPFPYADQAAVIAAHMTAAPPALSGIRRDLPPGLNEVIAIALAKDPDGRYRTCGDLAAAAQHAFATAHARVAPTVVSASAPGGFAGPVADVSEAPRTVSRRRMLVAGGIAVPMIAAAAAGIAVLKPFAGKAHSSPSQARADARDAALTGARQAAVNLVSANPDDADGSLRDMRSSATGALLEQLNGVADKVKSVMVSSGNRVTAIVLHAALTALDDGLEHARALVVLQQTQTPRTGAATVQQLSWQLGLTRTQAGWRADTAAAFGTATTQTPETAAADPPTGTGNAAFVDVAATDAIKNAGVQAMTALFQYKATDGDAYLTAVKAVTTDALYREISPAFSTAIDAARRMHSDVGVKLDPVGVTRLTTDQAELLCGMVISETKDGIPGSSTQGAVIARMQYVSGRWLVSDIPGRL